MIKLYHLILLKFSSCFHYYVQDPQEVAHNIKKIFKKWWVSVCDLLKKLIVLFCTTAISYALLLYFVKYLWFTYKNTHAGAIFIANPLSPPLLIVLARELDNSIIILSFTHCLNALLFSFFVGLFVQLTVIKRYFYDVHGWVVRLGWILGISILAGYYGGYYTSFTELQSQVALLLFPVCCLVNISFDLAAKCLPELPSFFQRKQIRKWIETAHIRNMDSRGDGD